MLLKIIAMTLIAAAISPSVSSWSELCSSEGCLEICKPPNNMTVDTDDGSYMRELPIQYHSRLRCLCVCGKKLGETCSSSLDCHEGLHCSDRATVDSDGYCRSQCDGDPNFSCGPLERCVPTLDGSPDCQKMVQRCCDRVVFPVCGDNGFEKMTFTNRCFMELYNQRLEADNLPRFRHHQKRACPGDEGSQLFPAM